MFRIYDHVMPEKKAIGIALTSVYGIGNSRSKTILDAVDIDFEKKVLDLSDEEQKAIVDELKKYLLENDLRRDVQSSIKRLKEIRCYRGLRHAMGMPVRGQKTNKHANTAKKLLGRSKVRPKLRK